MKMRENHGFTGHRLHNIWLDMIRRCNDERNNHYNYYGALGIKVCDEWLHSFKSFYDWSMKNEYSDELTIDRIDNNGNYEPSNCRWVTMKEQCNNRSSNRYITYKGKTQSLSKWCDELNLNYNTIISRLSRGFTNEEAFEEPIIEINNREDFIINYNNKEQSLKQWCIELDLDYRMVYRRIFESNWDYKKAFETPNRKRRN